MTGWRRWMLLGALVLAACLVPWSLAFRQMPSPSPGGGSCPFRAVASAQEGGGASVDVDISNIFGDGCFEVQITGLCPCPATFVCVRITYWEPRLLIVTEQVQADKHHGQLGQQYGEVTAYPFPLGAILELLGFDFLCTPEDLKDQTTRSAAASYSSRIDRVPWRTGGLEAALAELTAPGATLLSVGCAIDSLVSVPYLGGLCMGFWGPLFPRAGWLIHGSQPVGTGAAAYRAAHIISWPEFLWGRTAIPALDFRATTSDRMNIVAPKLMDCINPGTYPATWESEKIAADGIYAWVYWVKRTCCVQL